MPANNNFPFFRRSKGNFQQSKAHLAGNAGGPDFYSTAIFPVRFLPSPEHLGGRPWRKCRRQRIWTHTDCPDASESNPGGRYPYRQGSRRRFCGQSYTRPSQTFCFPEFSRSCAPMRTPNAGTMRYLNKTCDFPEAFAERCQNPEWFYRINRNSPR